MPHVPRPATGTGDGVGTGVGAGVGDGVGCGVGVCVGATVGVGAGGAAPGGTVGTGAGMHHAHQPVTGAGFGAAEQTNVSADADSGARHSAAAIATTNPSNQRFMFGLLANLTIIRRHE